MSTFQAKKTPWSLRFSLKNQIGLIHLCAIIIFSVLLYLAFKFGLKYWYLYILNNIGELISKNITDIISHMIIAEDYLSIHAIINKSCENNLIQSISVFSSDNIKIASTISKLQFSEKDIKEFLMTIHWHNEVIGYLHLTIDNHYLLSKLEFLAISGACLVNLILVIVFCISYLCVAIIEKNIRDISQKLYKHFNKKANQNHSPTLQLKSLLLIIEPNTKNKLKSNLVINASIAIKIKDDYITEANTEYLNKIIDKIAISAMHCGKYFLANVRLIKNSNFALSLFAYKNKEADRVVMCALVINRILADIISEANDCPIGIGLCIWPYNQSNNNIQNKLEYTLKLADINTKGFICIPQKSINYLSITDIIYHQDSKIPDVALFQETDELADRLKNDITTIKKIIASNNAIKKHKDTSI